MVHECDGSCGVLAAGVPVSVKLSTTTADETIRLGELVGRSLNVGDVVLLHGDLGAGKTTLVRGIARSLGFRGRVSSPTFALAHVYRGKKRTLHHLDLYRLKGGDLTELGLEELIEDPRGVVVVEWPEVVRLWPRRRIDVRMSHCKNGRKILIHDRRTKGRS